jgi:hypothetical protein
MKRPWLPAGVLIALTAGCASTGRLTYVAPIAPTKTHLAGQPPIRGEEAESAATPMRPLFGDTLIGLVPGTADSSRRFLGRLRDGYTSDTLNLFFFGDNRPGYRSTRLQPEYAIVGNMFHGPGPFLHGLVTIPWAVVKGLYPDLALVRDVPARLTHMPTWGREAQVLSAMLAKIDSLNAHGKRVAAVMNSGDLVKDGRYPKHWERFLRLTYPLSSRVPYFAVAGNHERTDTVDGRENWRTATGLPVGSDRLYYCFDSADGWVRFIALDTNPIVDPGSLWSREVQVKYSKEQFDWLVARVKEHNGPVIVMMHHPPFSAGYHRVEWQRDSVLVERREAMVRALHDAGISVIVSGHEHAYERALMTWPDAVLIAIVTGGGGAPLHALPSQAQSAQLFSEYRVAGGGVKPANVFTAQTFNFLHMRLWFGGGEFYAYAVDKKSQATQIDHVEIDLKRYGIPQIDQHKIPIPPAKGPKAPKEPEGKQHAMVAKSDTTASSQRILSSPSPAKAKTKKSTSPKTTSSAKPSKNAPR